MSTGAKNSSFLIIDREFQVDKGMREINSSSLWAKLDSKVNQNLKLFHLQRMIPNLTSFSTDSVDKEEERKVLPLILGDSVAR